MRIPAPAVLLLAACATTVNPVPVPVPGVSLQTWSVEVREPRARDIYMRNDSERDITITSVQLYNCRNLKQECKAYPSNVTIPAGKTVKAMRLEPENLKLSWHYSYNYQTRQSGGPGGQSGMFTVVTPSPGMGTQLSDPQEFTATVPAITENPTCHTRNPVQGPAGMTGWAIVFSGPQDNVRTVTVYVGPNGKPTQYSDVRNGANGQRTAITVLLEPRFAVMRNETGDGPVQQSNVSGPDVLTAASLGNPQAIVAYVMRECVKP